MNEYYVELADAASTYYGATGITGDVLYFDNLDDAKLFAKGQVSDRYILARVIDADRGRVVYFCQR